ncbi:UDP-N-acetylglucosamine 4,6-dehydratase (inverting) [Terasakiella pusilla]|uniref:UDP-N-acetylglucosamine 4,6-dehydratase (inverting) n=1 Tax=Terasakiella pusilla TaxID=64973 RepID=UPI003AA7BB28
MRNFQTETTMLDGASILITGGTGSFGNQFVQTVLDRYNPRRLVIFSRDELKQFEMQEKFKNHPRFSCLRFFIGDVRDHYRLEVAFSNIDYVIHSAALKQVPAAEYNPTEYVRTNIGGAENVVRAARAAGVKRVIALSTDKAASPLNLYGATKLVSDKIFVAGNNLSGRDGTRYSVVRYGNVVGSRGSVIPLFKRLIDEGCRELPVTDGRMTRFFITLDQGVDFVLSCLEKMVGGEVFVPKIPSMKIVDLVKAFGPDISTKITGIRPGEKLHEVMITSDDARVTVEQDDRYIIQPSFAFWTDRVAEHGNCTPLPEGYSYASDTNKEWLTQEEMHRLIEQET